MKLWDVWMSLCPHWQYSLPGSILPPAQHRTYPLVAVVSGPSTLPGFWASSSLSSACWMLTMQMLSKWVNVSHHALSTAGESCQNNSTALPLLFCFLRAHYLGETQRLSQLKHRFVFWFSVIWSEWSIRRKMQRFTEKTVTLQSRIARMKWDMSFLHRGRTVKAPRHNSSHSVLITSFQ